MQDVIIRLMDECKCQLSGLTTLDRNLLYKKFAVYIPTARYANSYKIGGWDGYIHYFNEQGVTGIGLLPEIFESIDCTKYNFKVQPYQGFTQLESFDEIDENYFSDKVWEKGHRLEGQPIILEDHQVRGINALLKNQKGIASQCTGAGKTLLSAVLAKEVSKRGKFLIIVPSRDLVINTAKQLNYLGIDTGTVFEGDRASQYAKPCVVTTWQGILSMCRRAEGKGHHLDDIKKLNKEQTKAYYDKNQKLVNFYKEEINKLYEAQKVDIANAKVELSTLCNGVYGFLFDECHLAKGHLVKEILNKMFPKVQVRFGCTGTVPKDKADRYCLFTSIGPVVDILSSKELQDKGFLAKCEVKMIQLKDTRKFIDFASEKTALSGDENRLSFVSKYTDYIAKTYGNTLILIDRIETGNILFKQLSELKADVVFLQGKDSVKKRTEEYSEINKENNKIIIATAQIASTGINIPRLFNLVLVDYGQSFTKTIQSVGRALRLGSDKNSAYIHDISSTTKYSKEHYKKRKAYYQEQSIPIEEMKLDNWSL